jgi:hypothetical protein
MFLITKLKKKNTPNLWCHRISISCDNLFRIEKGGFGFSSHANFKKKKEKKKSADSVPSNSGK